MIATFAALTQIFGHAFTSGYGQAINDDGELGDSAKTWLRLMRHAGVTTPQLHQAFNEIAKAGHRFPPNASEFIKICQGGSAKDRAELDARAEADRERQSLKALPRPHKRVTDRGIAALRNLQRMTGAKPATEITKGEG